MKESVARQFSEELFDIVKKYRLMMTSSEMIGALEMHKHDLISYHLNAIKEEMMKEKND